MALILYLTGVHLIQLALTYFDYLVLMDFTYLMYISFTYQLLSLLNWCSLILSTLPCQSLINLSRACEYTRNKVICRLTTYM